MTNYNISKRDLTVFFIVTFGLTISMGIIMSIAYPSYPIDAFPVLQMYYPAFGVMVALLLNKELRGKLPTKFFIFYIFFVITSIIYLLIVTFIIKQDPNLNLQLYLMIASILLLIIYATEDKEKTEKFGLKFKKNFKKSVFYIIIFIIIYLGNIFISLLIQGEIKEFFLPFKDLQKIFILFLLPLSFFTTFVAFFGEEYGWRYFLQPALQERIGKRKGVIILGVIWGLWHLPINMFYYSPETSLYSVMNQLTVCIAYSIFFGLVYIKTKNIWAISMIHFFNNNLGFILYGGEPKNLILTWQSVLFNIVLFSIVFIPFLLTKEYRKITMNGDIEKPEVLNKE